MTDHTVEFVGTGDRIEVSEKETILRRGLDEGVPMEYSCRVGMCLACCAEIEEGDVIQPAAHALTDEEKERYALTCMARPQSDLKLRLGRYPPSIEASGFEPAAGDATPADD